MTTKLDCGHAATPQGCAAGYARDDAGRTLCYPCADAQQRETLRTATRITLSRLLVGVRREYWDPTF